MGEQEVARTQTEATATISAKIIRADGTEVDLGVIGSVTNEEITKALKVLVPIREAHTPDDEALAIERAIRANKEESERNEEANARAASGKEK
jgi:uncharacterized protein YrzB (UPF0473 family)